MSLVHLFRNTLAGLRVLIAMTVLLGLVYPFAVLGIAQGMVPWKAQGSLVTPSGQHTTTPADAAGSVLIGQGFDGENWFHTRPSAAGEGWDTLASAGSNLGPESPDLIAAINERKAAIAAEEGVSPADVPADAVTASASGLDPDISVAYAVLQAPRVADARGLELADVMAMIEANTHGRTLGVLGSEHVNVIELNLDLQDGQ